MRSVPGPDAAPDAARNLQALTSKPVLYVANVDEGETEVPAALRSCAAGGGAAAVAVSARIESELAELDAGRGGGDARGAGRLRARPRAPDPRRLRPARPDHLLHRRRRRGGAGASLREGATAWDAAGRVHTDIQDGFVKAEVIGWRELVDAGGYAAARDRGILRTEGRDYVVADGDVVTIKH